jgi:geranylgeranyl diphosphate synthase, type I
MTKNSLFELIEEFKTEFEPYYKLKLGDYQTEAKNYVPEYEYNLSEVIRISTLQGSKRIRPFLVYLGYLLGNGNKIKLSKNNDLANLCFGLETFHSCALIFDDIIDKATTRRGSCTIETRYLKDVFFANKDKKHQAISATLLSGMLSQTIADNFINQIESYDIRNDYYIMQRELIAGQIDDTFGIGLKDFQELCFDDILQMMINKSGNYSIQKPLLFGLKLAGKSKDTDDFAQIDLIGKKLGIVFQIKDDLIGIFGDEKIIGKSNISDITEGKKTLIMQKLFERSNREQMLKIRKIVGNPKPIQNQIEWLKSVVISTGVKNELEDYINQLVNEINTEISQIKGLNTEYLNILVELAEYLLTRVK